MGWMFDTDGPYWSAVALLWAFLLISVPIAIVIAVVRTLWDRQERRDGRK